MNNTPLEDQVHEALHRTADPLQRAPFTVGDVRTRARRIQRRRAAVSAGAVAAVLAVAVPIGAAMVGPAQRSEVPPVTQPPAPQVTGTVRIDARSADVVDSVGVPLVDVDGPTLLLPDRTVQLPAVYETVTPYGDGWLAVNNVEGDLTLQVLDPDLEVLDARGPTGGVLVNPDGSRVAWSEYDDGRWQVWTADVAGGQESTYLDFPPGPREQRVEPVGFVSDVDVAVTQAHSDGTTSTFIADDGAPVALPGPITARTASPATGQVAGVTSSDIEGSCSSVVEGTAPTGDVAWETCQFALDHFSPDGQHLVGTVPAFGEYGSPTLAVLDATTGEVVVDFEVVLPQRQVGGVNETEVLWQDASTLVARVSSGDDTFIVRLGLDGSVQRLGVASAGASGLSMAEAR